MNADRPADEDFVYEWLTSDAGVVFRGRRIEDIHTRFQRLEVFDTPELGLMFRLDGSNMTSERDEFFYHENIVHVGALAQDAPRRAFIVGGGDGGAAEELLKHPTIERVVIAELDAEVVRVARTYLQSVHRGALDDPRVELRIGDGFAALREAGGQSFDILIMDLTDPAGPAEALYTTAFFREADRVLAPEGTLALHAGSPFFHAARFVEIIGRLREVFAIVRPHFVHVPLYGANWGMACASQRTDPLRLRGKEVDERLRVRQIAQLQYLNGDTFVAGFALPNYVREMLST